MAVISSKWVQVKEPSDITVDGVTVELDWTNNNIVGVKVIGPSGGILRITKGDYSEIKVLVPATVEKYRLHGTICDSPFDQLFDSEGDAEDRKIELDILGQKAVLIVEKIKVAA